VGFTALAAGLRWLLEPWLDHSLAFSTLYGAVAFAVWLGGYRPALLAIVPGFLACEWLFLEPRGTLGFGEGPQPQFGGGGVTTAVAVGRFWTFARHAGTRELAGWSSLFDEGSSAGGGR
jgi:hypothetical protein